MAHLSVLRACRELIEDMEPEILVSISLRLPQADRRILSEHLAPVIREAIIAGGDTVHISLQPFNPENDPFSE